VGRLWIKLFLIIFFISNVICFKSWAQINNSPSQAKTLESADSKVIKGLFVTANGDINVGDQGIPVSINVLNNDFGIDGGLISFRVVKTTKKGKARALPNNHILYTPNGCFVGQDTITYEICSTVNCSEALVYIYVKPGNSRPTAVRDEVEFKLGSKTGIPVLNNDEFCTPTISVSILKDISNGHTAIEEIGSNDFRLLPIFNSDFAGLDSLVYQLCEPDGDCDQAKVIFNVVAPDFSSLEFPHGFSPNGDGYNDYYFVPALQGYPNVVFKVINEWGQVVYETPSFGFLEDGKGWDGYGSVSPFVGKALPAGTYYYIFQIPDEATPITGFVYLSR